jgi:hypothetical protein
MGLRQGPPEEKDFGRLSFQSLFLFLFTEFRSCRVRKIAVLGTTRYVIFAFIAARFPHSATRTSTLATGHYPIGSKIQMPFAMALGLPAQNPKRIRENPLFPRHPRAHGLLSFKLSGS